MKTKILSGGIKRFCLAILFVLLFCDFAISQQPTTTWPYIFDKFSPATVYLSSGGKIEYTANIHLAHSYMHYIDGDVIKEAKVRDILVVEINGKKFMNVNSSLMQVVREKENGFVAMLLEPDYSKLNETGGAYGGPSNTLSTKALTSIEGFGLVTNHMMQASNKNHGKVLPLKKSYYIVAGGSIYPAVKSVIADFLPLNKKDSYKTFLKKNKIKWGNPDDLIKLIDVLQ